MYRVFLSVSLAVLATILLGTVAPLHALTDSCCRNDGQLNYNNGWDDGQQQATHDWNEGYKVPNQDCHHHTAEYCSGYFNGYGDLWNRSIALNYPSTTASQSQSADVNIKGNNNQVTVNQGQSSNSGNGNYR